MNKECQELYLEAQKLFNKPRKSLKIGKQMLTIGKETGDFEAMAYGHHLLGSSMFIMGKDQGLMLHATQAVAFFRQIEDKIMLVRALNLQGIAYTAADEYQMALSTYMEAYELAKQVEKSKYRRDIILANIAATYFSLGDKRRALHIMEKIYTRMYRYVKMDASFLLNNLYNMADIHCELGEPEKALEYCKEGAEFWASCDEKMLRGTEDLALNLVTTKVYYRLGDVEQGNIWSDKVTELIRTGLDNFELHRDYESIVMMQLDVGEYDRADFYADFLWDSAQKSKNTLDILRATRMQARYFDLQDNTRMALYYYRMMDRMNETRNAEAIASQLRIAKNNEILVKKMKMFQRTVREKEELEILASRDALTGLLNRNALPKYLDMYVEQSKKEGKPVGCIFIDVDCFKEYNDTYGHIQGDECLKNIADACKSVKGDKMHFIRYGGDEVFGIGYGLTNEEICDKAMAIANAVRAYDMKHEASEVSDRVSVSVGILNFVLEEDSNMLDVVNFSDRALYHSKECGRNCVHMFDENFYKETKDMNFIKVQ